MNLFYQVIAKITAPFDKNPRMKWGMYGVLASFVLLLPLMLSFLSNGTYLLSIINYLFVYIVATTGLNVMTGYTGQINLGGAAYFAVGAYSVNILLNAGVPSVLSILLGMCIVAFVGFLTAIPAAKLKYHFLALATVAIGEVVNNFLIVSPGGITNDTHGMFVKPLELFGLRLSSYESLFYFLLAMTALVLMFTKSFINSKTGRACIATRDSIEAAGSCGVNFKTYKILATTVACVLIGFGGFLFSLVNRYISPDTFAAGKSTMFISMVVIGGSGTLMGPVLGAVLITFLMEGLRAVPNGSIYMQLAYAVLLLVSLVFLPNGINGLVVSARQKINEAKALEKMNHAKEGQKDAES